MASVHVYSNIEKLKADRIARTLSGKERLYQQKATKSLTKLKKVSTKALTK